MSAPTTYDALKVELRNFRGIDVSSDFAASVDLFIDLAESRFNAELRTRNQITTATLSLDANGEADLPTDYAGYKRAVALEAARVDLEEVSPEWMTDQYPIDCGGIAQHIAVEGGTVRVRPITSADVQFIYYAKIPALSDSNTTNWLLTKMPGLYLAACLLEWAVYFDEAEDEQRFGRMMSDQMGLLHAADRSERVKTRSVRVKGATP